MLYLKKLITKYNKYVLFRTIDFDEVTKNGH